MARIQKRTLSVPDEVAIERDGETAATVRKALIGIRARFAIGINNGADMSARGNIVDHEYEIERNGDTVATLSKKWCLTPTASTSRQARMSRPSSRSTR